MNRLQKGFEICKILQKYNYIFADLQEMFVISLSSFVIQQQILNLTNQCSLFMTVRYIFWSVSNALILKAHSHSMSEGSI